MNAYERERDFWERHAENFDRSLKLFGRPYPRVLELTGDGVSGAQDVLEVAAGTGLITKSIAPRVRHVVAMDYANAMVAVLRRRIAKANLSNVECVSGDIYALAYPPASFDVVVAGNVLHLVPDLSGALGELIRVLRPGGKLIAPTFCHDETRLSWLVSRALSVLGQPMHRRFTTASLRRALEEVGLRIRRSETIPGLIPIAHIEGVLQV